MFVCLYSINILVTLKKRVFPYWILVNFSQYGDIYMSNFKSRNSNWKSVDISCFTGLPKVQPLIKIRFDFNIVHCAVRELKVGKLLKLSQREGVVREPWRTV